jgi:hypothetical protein
MRAEIVGIPVPVLAFGMLFGMLMGLSVFAVHRFMRYLGKRDRAFDPQRRRRSSQAIALLVLECLQVGLGAIVITVTVKMVLRGDSPVQLIGPLIFAGLAWTFGRAARTVKSGTGKWLSARMRLTAITPRVVEFVLVAEGINASEPIKVQAEYWNNGRYRGRSSELLWRSHALVLPALCVPGGSEFRGHFVMPDDVPQQLAMDDRVWVRHWDIQIKISEDVSLNFGCDLPNEQTARR